MYSISKGQVICMPEIETIRTIIRPIAIEYGLKKIYLFGSYAKGTAKELFIS